MKSGTAADLSHRRVVALSTHDPTTGAATKVVAIAGTDGNETIISWIPLEHLAATDWRDRVALAGQLPGALAHWAEAANGITFDVIELEAPSSPDLRGSIEILVDEFLAFGDADATDLQWLAAGRRRG